MRIHSASLGLYVPGHGMRAFVPATFSIPPQPAGIGVVSAPGSPGNLVLPPITVGSGANAVTRTSQWVETSPGQYQHQIGWSQGGGPATTRTIDWGVTPGTSTTPGAITRQNALITGPGGKTYQIPGGSTFTGGIRPTSPVFTGSGTSSGTSGFGDFIPARKGWWAAMYPGMSGYGGDDCGCGCGGGCGGGMGQISTAFSTMVTDIGAGNWSNAWSDFLTLMGEPVIGTMPLWVIGGGLILVWALFFSGGQHSRYQRGRRASQAAARAYA